MPLVDDTDRGQQHSATEVQPGLDEKIKVGLLQSYFPLFLATFDQRVLQFKLAPELDAVREAMTEQEHEAMEVAAAWLARVLVEMGFHVAGDRQAHFPIGGSLVVAGHGDWLKGRGALWGNRACGIRIGGRCRLPRSGEKPIYNSLEFLEPLIERL